jgi:hypothetical protein
MKIRSVGAELFHTDGRTDGGTDGHEEAFHSFFKAPKFCFLTLPLAGQDRRPKKFWKYMTSLFVWKYINNLFVKMC